MNTETDQPPVELRHSYHSRKPDGWPRWLWRLVSRARYRCLRKWAAANGKDFEHRCRFFDQIGHIGRGLSDTCGTIENVRVPMQSGAVAIYTVTVSDDQYGGTGQKDWRFVFQGYADWELIPETSDVRRSAWVSSANNDSTNSG